VGDLFESDETVAYHEEARYIDRRGREEKGGIELETRWKPDWQYKELLEENKREMLAPRRTFNHAINLKAGAEPPWCPIYPMSAYQLN